ncbi:Hypothetical predicted protein [Podarcis lilfordi]|uniref:Maestro-like HEAT-repeats domain-containing protein n=1 Tax=Podarcis lilfordi TaxID=74358 RepID=A0AA35PB51_9SAUR|nr:Hypothetical predicted protein [Podarcis lilfordi]
MRRKEAMLKETTWGWEAILRARWILNPTEGPSPELFLHNGYVLPMVFGAYLPPEQLLEAVCHLARDLAVKGIFMPLKIHALLHQILDKFSGKAMQVELLLEAFLQNAKGPSMEQQKVALFAFYVLAKQCPENVMGYLLQFPLSDSGKIWKVVLSSADHPHLIHLLTRLRATFKESTTTLSMAI